MQHDVYSCSILNQVCYKLTFSLIKAKRLHYGHRFTFIFLLTRSTTITCAMLRRYIVNRYVNATDTHSGDLVCSKRQRQMNNAYSFWTV